MWQLPTRETGTLPHSCTHRRQQWHGGIGGRGGTGGGIFIAAGIFIPSIVGSSGGVHCCPCCRDEDACIVIVIAGVVVNVNGTNITIVVGIFVFFVLTAAIIPLPPQQPSPFFRCHF